MHETYCRILTEYFPLFFVVLMGFLFAVFYLYKEYVGKKYHGAYYLPSNAKQVATILKFVGDDTSKKIADLGSGDGRILVKLAKHGFQITGYEIDPVLVKITEVKIFLNNLSDKTSVYKKNFWDEDLSKFDVAVLFGIGHMVGEMEDKLKRELKHGSKIISVRFSFPNLKLLKEDNNVYLYEA